MKFSEKWLREWTNPKISTKELADELTMAGLEVDSILPASQKFDNVVIGEVVEVNPHPNADRLRICDVNIGKKDLLSITCGAKNARPTLKVAVALIGAQLPTGLKIKKAKIRGIESQGMLCSTSELGIEATSEGIMELPSSAPIGEDLRNYLNLNDNILEIELTPNRGDCLSILGIAREVAAINKLKVKEPEIKNAKETIKNKLPIHISAKSACPHYTGRIIRDINCNAKTPIWMQEKLNRSGINCISPLVDITNYVMLELGQPLHAFDLAKITSSINIRYAKAKESITLLDNTQLNLDNQTTVIADNDKALAVAGIMGGLYSGIDKNTTSIFLESAYFNPEDITKGIRRYNLQTDSSHRFERGVDPNLQIKAMQRATNLILDIIGGQAGPIGEVKSVQYLPKPSVIKLRKSRIERILGVLIDEKDISSILQNLGMELKKADFGWIVAVPSYRSDLKLEIDLIEEIARIFGYNKIPPSKPTATLVPRNIPANELNINRIKSLFVDRGYQEAVTYSFVDPKLQHLLDPEHKPIALENPIAVDLSVMRTNMWAGLMKAILHNYRHQYKRIRLFEIGNCFTKKNNKPNQQMFIGGIIAGLAYPDQWGMTKRDIDFFDIKNDIQALLHLAGYTKEKIVFRPEHSHPALHPNRCANIFYQDNLIGYLGRLHPQIQQELDIEELSSIYLFNMDIFFFINGLVSKFKPFSKYPKMSRDIAIVVNEDIPVQQIIEKIIYSGGELLQIVKIFDIYRGKSVDEMHKSIALNLVFQHHSRTLMDCEVDKLVEFILKELKQTFKAKLRE